MFVSAAICTTLLIGQSKKEIVYRVIGETELKCDYYAPAITPEKPAPFVIVIHGGTWMAGKKEDMSSLCEALSKEGIASATIQYRLAPRNKWPSMIDDCQSAVRYFRANAKQYSIDPDRFGATGASAGGHLALLLGLTDTWDKETKAWPDVSSKVSCVVNLFGPTDLRADFDRQIAGLLSNAILGKPIEQAADDIKAFSPVTYVTKEAIPIFTLQGDSDNVVPPMQATRLDDAMKAVGRPHILRMVKGLGHTIDLKNPDCASALQEAIAFFKSQFAMQ